MCRGGLRRDLWSCCRIARLRRCGLNQGRRQNGVIGGCAGLLQSLLRLVLRIGGIGWVDRSWLAGGCSKAAVSSINAVAGRRHRRSSICITAVRTNALRILRIRGANQLSESSAWHICSGDSDCGSTRRGNRLRRSGDWNRRRRHGHREHA